MSKKNNTIANDMAVLDVVFEELRTKLNEMKAEGKLNHDDVSILPFTFGMMAETARAFIESRKPEFVDTARKIVSIQMKNHIGEIMPWPEFLKYTGELE